ncbi:unnamed protein product [Medioppia subpectinata]|uniref:CUB domain-containing protein n=1 Tax=Medioppia subpectinata TaxID=1979941 RepID=A0A7R9Q1E4_9ACAR|nr:unnamed protein product [Medioppia subpectinata]CAG2109001.1 unnamed protein product [Medioppia subpectinata]
MHIRFFAKPDALQNTDFAIMYTQFREINNSAGEKCWHNEFDCQDNTCIDRSLICDGWDNCLYRYDEDKRTTCAPECKFNKTGINGLIKEKEIPAELLNYAIVQELPLDCIWNITVQHGYQIYLYFTDYRLNQPNNCESNFIEVYHNNMNISKREYQFCATLVESVRSKTNVMHIRFFAKHNAIQTTRFEIIYTAYRQLKNRDQCRPNEFDCEDGTCIDRQLECDGWDNCEYRYDEDLETTCAPDQRSSIMMFISEQMVAILVVIGVLMLGVFVWIAVFCWKDRV